MNKSNHQIAVEAFMRYAGQYRPPKPCEPITEVRALRARLILEEAFETVNALGFDVYIRHEPGVVNFCQLELKGSPTGFNLVEAVDGCCDLKVVTTGTLSAMGVADDAVQNIVDAANLRKFGPGSYKDANGKWQKPPDFVPPQEDLLRELQQQAMHVQ